MGYSPTYSYDETNVRRYAPLEPGVYRLMYPDTAGRMIVFYIGKSDVRLEDRLLAHLQPSEQNGCIKLMLKSRQCFFDFVVIASQFERDTFEKQEIQRYNPQCNRT